ncbi:MAG TPA: DUF3618 domain-containing protein [Mycobacteriales bacterium]|nr:DUF3618 domain-containing protein [Mycobacteriales bacterium]
MARDPDVIQREIEQTRTELAETVDAITERISPKRAASRFAAAVVTAGSPRRSLRTDRVLLVVGAAAAVAAVFVLRRSR